MLEKGGKSWSDFSLFCKINHRHVSISHLTTATQPRRVLTRSQATEQAAMTSWLRPSGSLTVKQTRRRWSLRLLPAVQTQVGHDPGWKQKQLPFTITDFFSFPCYTKSLAYKSPTLVNPLWGTRSHLRFLGIVLFLIFPHFSWLNPAYFKIQSIFAVVWYWDFGLRRREVEASTQCWDSGHPGTRTACGNQLVHII